MFMHMYVPVCLVASLQYSLMMSFPVYGIVFCPMVVRGGGRVGGLVMASSIT